MVPVRLCRRVYISIIDWLTQSLKRVLCCNTFPTVVPAKVAPRYVEGFWQEGMRLEFAKVVWGRYKSDSSDLKIILLLGQQSEFVQKNVTDRASDLPKKIGDEKDS